MRIAFISIGFLLFAKFPFAQHNVLFFKSIDTGSIIFQDTLNNFVFDSLVNNLGQVPVDISFSIKKFFKYIGEEDVFIYKTWTSDPHFICEWPREKLDKNKTYSYTVCFNTEGFKPGLPINKVMGIDFNNGTRIILRFKGTFSPK